MKDSKNGSCEALCQYIAAPSAGLDISQIAPSLSGANIVLSHRRKVALLQHLEWQGFPFSNAQTEGQSIHSGLTFLTIDRDVAVSFPVLTDIESYIPCPR